MKLILILLPLVFLTGCSEPLEEGDRDFVGMWRNNQSTLLITDSGRLEYESSKGAVKTSISMPIKTISDSQIVAGFLFMKSTFELGGRPAQQQGRLGLIVDGETLFKADEFGRILPSTLLPGVTEIRTLVTDELNRLGAGIFSSDFSGYLDNTAQIFQSQFSNEKLIAGYKPFIDQQVDLVQWMQGEFVLTQEPTLDENGVLKLVGKYPTTPSALNFTLGFIHTDAGWKGVQAEIAINDA